MKLFILTIILLTFCSKIKAQTCDEIMEHVKSLGDGTIYTSCDGDAISKVTFYGEMINCYEYYFAVVCFKQENPYDCSEYVYLVESSTETVYSTNYIANAGQAFLDFIKPHSNNLGCATNID